MPLIDIFSSGCRPAGDRAHEKSICALRGLAEMQRASESDQRALIGQHGAARLCFGHQLCDGFISSLAPARALASGANVQRERKLALQLSEPFEGPREGAVQVGLI